MAELVHVSAAEALERAELLVDRAEELRDRVHADPPGRVVCSQQRCRRVATALQ
jgi:hypothetical protein